MVYDGFEVFVGVNIDLDWGFVFVFGVGGVLVEVFGDVVFWLLLFCDGDVEVMIVEMCVGVLFVGYCGCLFGDCVVFVCCLIVFVDFVWVECYYFVEIDVNFIVVSECGCVVVDVFIVFCDCFL